MLTHRAKAFMGTEAQTFEVLKLLICFASRTGDCKKHCWRSLDFCHRGKEEHACIKSYTSFHDESIGIPGPILEGYDKGMEGESLGAGGNRL